MKLRFLGLLAAIGLGSAAVLVYASQSRESATSMADCSDSEDCGACSLSAAPVAQVDDACCATETVTAPVAATVEKE